MISAEHTHKAQLAILKAQFNLPWMSRLENPWVLERFHDGSNKFDPHREPLLILQTYFSKIKACHAVHLFGDHGLRTFAVAGSSVSLPVVHGSSLAQAMQPFGCRLLKYWLKVGAILKVTFICERDCRSAWGVRNRRIKACANWFLCSLQ